MKKVLSMLLAFFGLSAALTMSVSAEDKAVTVYPVVIHMDDSAERMQANLERLSYLSSVATNLTIIDGNAHCQGNYSTAGTRLIRLTMELQRCSSASSYDSDWSTIQTWTQSWNTSGTHMLTKKSPNISSGWYYRVATTATVLDGDLPLEIVKVYSIVRHY